MTGMHPPNPEEWSCSTGDPEGERICSDRVLHLGSGLVIPARSETTCGICHKTFTHPSVTSLHTLHCHPVVFREQSVLPGVGGFGCSHHSFSEVSAYTFSMLLSSKSQSFLWGVGGFAQAASSLHLGFTLSHTLRRSHGRSIPFSPAPAARHWKRARRLVLSYMNGTVYATSDPRVRKSTGGTLPRKHYQTSVVQTTTVQTK
ncbi:hypothetical protein ISCGN_021637 [Ixodes scapularis]